MVDHTVVVRVPYMSECGWRDDPCLDADNGKLINKYEAKRIIAFALSDIVSIADFKRWVCLCCVGAQVWDTNTAPSVIIGENSTRTKNKPVRVKYDLWNINYFRPAEDPVEY